MKCRGPRHCYLLAYCLLKVIVCFARPHSIYSKLLSDSLAIVLQHLLVGGDPERLCAYHPLWAATGVDCVDTEAVEEVHIQTSGSIVGEHGMEFFSCFFFHFPPQPLRNVALTSLCYEVKSSQILFIVPKITNHNASRVRHPLSLDP